MAERRRSGAGTYRRLPPAASARERAELARDIVAGLAYTHESVPADLVQSVFLPVALGALAGHRRRQLRRLVVFAVERRHKSTGVYINGYPMFVECRIWRRADFAAAVEQARAVEAALGLPADAD